MNVLLLSSGRQVFLVQAFRSALNGSADSGKILVADIDPFAPALAVADLSLVAPRTADDGFAPWLLEVCISHAPLLILTLHEHDLYVLEPMRAEFNDLGARLVGIPTDALDICMDKQKLSEMCFEIGLSAPATWPGESLAYMSSNSLPLILKKRAGRGSRGQQFITNPENLPNLCISDLSDWCIQQVITGTEFGIDVINDLNGRFVTVFAREKIAMREGETAAARTVDAGRFSVVARALSERFAHQGCMDVDVIVHGEEVMLLDVNPRFGGGYPFSHLAGADLPAALLSWASGNEPDPRCLQPKVGFLGAKASTVVRLHDF